MKFKKGTHVYSADAQDVGVIDRVVLDPQSSEVTGMVIRQGFMFSEDKVVPIELINDATEERAILRKPEAALDQLPPFEERYYVPANEQDYGSAENAALGTYVDPLYGYPPLGTAWWGYAPYGAVPPIGLEPDVVERVQRNIPPGTLAIKEGASVLSSDDEHVGNVEEVFTDPETNHATHFVISKGLFFKERKLIPTSWVHIPGEEEIMLTVPTSVVEALPDYRD